MVETRPIPLKNLQVGVETGPIILKNIQVKSLRVETRTKVTCDDAPRGL